MVYIYYIWHIFIIYHTIYIYIYSIYTVYMCTTNATHTHTNIVNAVDGAGFLKPTPEHCCWIMHSWCNLVLKIGFSAPKVQALPL